MSTVSSAEPVTRRARPLPILGTTVFALLMAVVVQMWGMLAAGADPALEATGSSFAGVAIDSWTSDAGILYGTNVNFQISNSVTGLSFFAQNQVDFGASDIPYSTGQSPYNPNVPYQYLPDVAGGLALMYNLTNPSTGQRVTDLNLNAQAVAEIFLGQITNWDNSLIQSLNPTLGSIDVPIDPVYRSDGAGENYLLSDYLLHQTNGTFVNAQRAFGLSTTGPSAIGSPSATWPTPVCENNGGCSPSQLPGYPGWTTGTGLTGASGADISANDVAAGNADGAITYVETAYAKEHQLPVANLENASGNAVQPTSVNVATAMEKAILHPDLTQDLSGVYTNPISNAYPLSSYSYLVTQCSPSLAASQKITSCDGGGAYTFPTSKASELGQFLDFMACAGQQSMASIGYSPLPPNLVQEDFWAIGRMEGASEPPPPTAANCKNPYVDGQTPLPGEPVIEGLAPGQQVTVPTAASSSHGGAGGTGSGGSGGGSGGTGGNGGGSGAAGAGGTGAGAAGASATPAAIAEACQNLSKKSASLAAQACSANGSLKSGFVYANGQIVRTLPGGLTRALRADALVDATQSVLGPRAAELILWILVALIVLAGPPLIAYYLKRSRTPGRKTGGQG